MVCFHISRPCGSAAHRRDEHPSWEGCALPNPPRGRGLGARASGPRPLRYGETRFPHPPRRGRMFTLAVHAAPPHNTAMNIRLFLGGLRPPRPSRGWGHGETRFPHPPAGRGRGETGFPHTPRRGPMFTSAAHAAAPHNAAMNMSLFLGELRPPRPSRGRGRGETRFPHTSLRELMFTLAHRATLRASPQRCRNAALPAPRRHWPGGPLLAVRCRRPAPWSPRPRRYPLPRSCRRPR